MKVPQPGSGSGPVIASAGSLSALAAPIAAFLAEDVFGYVASDRPVAEMDPGSTDPSASRLYSLAAHSPYDLPALEK